jgi:L-fuculose-phosphate aldolase
MPDRRPASYGCEDEACEALLKARETVNAIGGSPGAACLSMRWQRSGGRGMLFAAAPSPSSPHAASTILWLPLQEQPGAPAAEAPATNEWRLHRDLYLRRTDIEAIVRCRATYATTLACSRAAGHEGLAAFHPDVAAAAGGALACVDCGLPGAPLHSEPLLAALHGRRACLLAGWGLLTCGVSLAAATSCAAEVEALARIWWHVLQIGP